MPRVRRLEHARRDRRPRAHALGTGDRPRPDDGRRRRNRWPASPRPTCRASASGSTSSIASSAAVSSPARWSCVGGEPGIGKSTLLLQAAAGLARTDGGGTVLYATGEESPGQVRLRAARLGLLSGPAGERVHVLAEHDVGRIVEIARAERPGAGRRRFDPDGDRRRPRGRGRQRRPGPRIDAPPDGAGQGRRDRGHPRRPRDQGRLDRRPEDPRAPGRCRPRTSRASATPRCAWCARPKNRFGSTDEVGVFEMAEAGLLEVADPARAFLADHGGVRARQHRRADARGQPAAARRGPGPCQPDRLRHAVAQGERPRSEPARAAHRGPRPARRDRPRQPRRLREPGRRAVGRRAGARPAARPRPRLVAARPPDRRRGPWRSARSGCSASCAPSSASSAACARRLGSGSGGRSCRGQRGGATLAPIDGLEVVAGRHACARRSRPRWPTAPPARGEAVPAMLG